MPGKVPGTKWGLVTVSCGDGEKAESLDGGSVNPGKAFSEEVQTQPSHWWIWGQDCLCAEGHVEIRNGNGFIKQEMALKSEGELSD